jgi:hypothetical protein
MASETEEIYVEVKAETDKAILVDYEGKEYWLPKSQLEDWPDVEDGGDIEVPLWLLEEKGMV